VVLQHIYLYWRCSKRECL